MRRQGYYSEPEAVHQPWRGNVGLHLAKVLTVDPATGTCGVEITEGSQPLPATVVSPNANSGNGLIWLPQVGDLVVVGFLDTNATMPIILGSLYAKNDTLHSTNDGDMTVRHQSGTSLVIAKDGTITITQAAGATVTMKPNGDVEVKHATSNADVLLDSAGVELTQGSVKAHVGTDKISLDAGGGAKIDILPGGGITVTPGGSGVINLGGGTNFVIRDGDVTGPPVGVGVPDHYHVLIPSSTKVIAG